MMVLFWDTESNGLPKDYRAPVTQLDNWPRIIQLAWSLADMATEEVISSQVHLIFPDGWEIPSEQTHGNKAEFWIKHGYSTEKSIEVGKPMGKVLDYFIEAVNQCDIMVAHNVGFDYPITAAEMIRYERAANKNPNRIKVCTMETTVGFCKIPFAGRVDNRPWKKQNYKWPTLAELYTKLFEKDFEGAHDAGNDVSACRECFFELIRRKVIKFANNDQGQLILV